MDFYKVPMGFEMALSMNPFALNVYSSMTEEEKQDILRKAHNVRSEDEMRALVSNLEIRKI